MANETLFLYYAFLMGIFITFVYDILRIFRRVIPHGNFWVSLEDIGFWIYCAAEVFLLMYHESDGTLRWFAIFGAMLGMIIYKKLVSPIFVKYVSLVLQKVVWILGKIGNILFKPLRVAGKGTAKVSKGIFHKIGRSRHFLKKKLTFFLKVLKMNL